MQRTASASALGARGNSGLRSGVSSMPRRRPYESTPLRGAGLGDRGDGFGSRPRTAASGLPHRTDALQLETRLTERLREHSMSSTQDMRRPGVAEARGGALQKPGGYSGASTMGPWHGADESVGYGGAPSMPQSMLGDSRYSTPGSHFDRRSGASPAPGENHRRSPPSWNDRRGARPHAGPEPTPPPPGHDSTLSRHSRRPPHEGESLVSNSSLAPPQGGGVFEGSTTLPESRLKIYSDLFEEVIERDRVFGSLLRKIKTAYDMLLLQCMDERAVPPMPNDNSSASAGHLGGGHRGGPGDSHWTPERGAGGIGGNLHSNEPTTRNEAWEMQRENRVLKDLVERLHLELEETVQREQRWKHKATKLKQQRVGDGARLKEGEPPRPPQAYHEPGHPHYQQHAQLPGHGHMGGMMNVATANMSHHHEGANSTVAAMAAQSLYHGCPGMPPHDVMAAQYLAHPQHMQQVQGYVQPGHPGQPLPPQHPHHFTQHMQEKDDRGTMSGCTSMGGMLMQEDGGMPKDGSGLAMGGPIPKVMPVGVPGQQKSFHASRREPTGTEGDGAGCQEGLLNQGGLLSLSSISPQTSPPPPQPDPLAGNESSRSTDSGMLPQRPTRRIVVKPENVPALDFSRLRQHVEEDEQEEEYEDVANNDPAAMTIHPGMCCQEEVEEEYPEDHEAEEEYPAFDFSGHAHQAGVSQAVLETYLNQGGTLDELRESGII